MAVSSGRLRSRLEESGLKPRQKNLQGLLQSAFDYVKQLLRPKAIEGTVQLDPRTQLPSGVTGKITFAEPSWRQAEEGIASVDRLLELGDEALAAANYKVWILLDRLDVALSDSPDLEQKRLEGPLPRLSRSHGTQESSPQIFLRTDIWRRITTSGFREG